jgi:metal-responsive CopG/Arc/MetJ family transcriptional regulator
MNSNTITRISATLPENLVAFLDTYREEHALESRSAALAAAIEALRERELQRGYRELGQAQRQNLETYPPDNTDGLEPEDARAWR